jgi:di/tricarboxylate transporter
VFGDSVVEVTISNESKFIGKRFLDVSNVIYRKYMSAAVSLRSASGAVIGDKSTINIPDSVSDTIVRAGDTFLLISSKEGLKRLTLSSDIASIFEKSRLTVPSTYWSFYPVLSFFVIVSLVASQKVEMSAASLSMASFFFIGGWIVPKEIEKFVDIRLLMLMGASLSFAKAMTSTGLATKIAEAIAGGVSDPTANLFLIYLATLLITELISNNAAAAMMYPIAVVLADTLGVSYKPYVMVVMQAASMAFMCPIGYPTHVMVWLPGQYNFFDFCKFGLFPNFMWMIMSVLISKAAWPL